MLTSYVAVETAHPYVSFLHRFLFQIKAPLPVYNKTACWYRITYNFTHFFMTVLAVMKVEQNKQASYFHLPPPSPVYYLSFSTGRFTEANKSTKKLSHLIIYNYNTYHNKTKTKKYYIINSLCTSEPATLYHRLSGY